MTTQEFKHAFPNVYIIMVDSTPFPCLSFSSPTVMRLHWNFHHTMIAKCVTFAITTTGHVVWVGSSVPGSIHDREALNQSDFCRSLASFYAPTMRLIRDQHQNIQLAVGGDKGYVGSIIPQPWKMYLPANIKKWFTSHPADYGDGHFDEFKFYSPSKAQAVQSAALAQFRGKIENINADLKDNKLLVNPEFTWYHNEMFDDVVRESLATINFNQGTDPQ